MEEVHHRMIETNGIKMHVAEKGPEGAPAVLLLHGFPELWFSWRHQIAALAASGYRVLAPDMRGYGDTDAPPDPATYSCLHLVGDLIGLLDQIGEEKVFVVGHDWGALVAWYLCLFRPDRVRALVNLSVPYYGRPPLKTTTTFLRLYGEGFYICQFQEPGRAERAFAKYDTSQVMKKFLSIHTVDPLVAPPGMEIIDSLETPSSLPAWLSEEELQQYATKFQKTGFTGALNYYRAMDLNWELLAPWQRVKIRVPTKIVVGDKDIGTESLKTKEYVMGEGMRTLVPDLQSVVLDGHHFIQQEKAEEVTQEILSFFRDF